MHISTKCSIALHCLLFLQQYGERNKVTSQLLSRSTGCNAAAIRAMVSAMKKNGLIAVKPGTGGAVLCCPPEEITLLRVYQAVEPDFLQKLIGVHKEPSHLCPIGLHIDQVLEQSYEKVREDLRISLGRITLADLLRDYQALEPPKK